MPESRSATSLLRSTAESHLEHLARGVAADQLGGRALGHDRALVDDHEPIAELLGLVHVVGGEEQRGALLLEAEQPVPEDVAGLRVEAGGRLVEEQDARIVDQRPGDREAALHAAGERVDLRLALLLELREREELVGALRDDPAGQAEVAAVDEEVLAHAQLGVEVVGLRHDAELRPDLGPVASGSRPRIDSSPAVRVETAPTMRIVVDLPAPFGPSRPKDSPGATSNEMPSTAAKSP